MVRPHKSTLVSCASVERRLPVDESEVRNMEEMCPAERVEARLEAAKHALW